MKCKLSFPPPDLAYAIVKTESPELDFILECPGYVSLAMSTSVWSRCYSLGWMSNRARKDTSVVAMAWWEKWSWAVQGGKKQEAGDMQHILKASLGTGTTESPEPTCPSPEGRTVPCPEVPALVWAFPLAKGASESLFTAVQSFCSWWLYLRFQ